MQQGNIVDIKTENFRLAEKVIGSEQAHSTPDIIVNGENAKSIIERENRRRFNNSVEELNQKFQKHIDGMAELGRKISEDFSNLEIMPLTSYVLISPYENNPFQKMKVDKSGLIIDTGGLTPTYKSQETGAIEEEKEYVRTGIVVETGTECKFLKPGDIVFYNIASEVQVPFYKFGFVIVAEQRIIAVVNEKLTTRKDEIMKNKPIDD